MIAFYPDSDDICIDIMSIVDPHQIDTYVNSSLFSNRDFHNTYLDDTHNHTITWVPLRTLRVYEQLRWFEIFANMTHCSPMIELLRRDDPTLDIEITGIMSYPTDTSTDIHVPKQLFPDTARRSSIQGFDEVTGNSRSDVPIDFDLHLAKTYVLDATKGRIPNVRIQCLDSFLDVPYLTPLFVYNLLHHRFWRWFFTLVVMVLLGVGVFEYSYPHRCAAVEVAMICL